MLDLYSGGVCDGTAVHQWEGAPASSQLWVVEPGNDGRVKIKSNLAGKCLDVIGMNTDNGAGLQIWADVNGDNQYWTIAEVTRKPKTSAKAAAAKEAAKAKEEAVEAPKAEPAKQAETPKAVEKAAPAKTAEPKEAVKPEAPKAAEPEAPKPDAPAKKAPAKKPVAKKAAPAKKTAAKKPATKNAAPKKETHNCEPTLSHPAPADPPAGALLYAGAFASCTGARFRVQ